MTPPFLLFLLVPALVIAFVYGTAWPVGLWLAVMVCSWKFWRRR